MSSDKKLRQATVAASGLDFWAGRIGNALLIASIVFAAFVGYTFSAPTVYRSSALLAVDFPERKAPQLKDAAQAERRVQQEVLDAATIARLGADVSAGKLRAGFEVHTLDGRSFSVAFRDANRFRAQRVTAELARRTAAVLPKVAAPQESPAQAREAARQKRLDELLNFLAEHPEFSATPAQAAAPAASASASDGSARAPAPPKPTINNDPALATLHLERKHVEERLNELAGPRGSSLLENPYQDSNQIWTNPPKLRRRLNEIDRLVEARRSAILRHAEEVNPPKAAPPLSPELAREWQRLLEALRRVPAESSSVAPAVTAKIVRGASLPRWPIEPNRVLLLWLGAVFGLIAGAIVALRPRPRAARQREKQRASLPSIARSLPLIPQAPVARDSPLPLALVRPSERVIGQSIPVRLGASDLAARRSASWRQELGPRNPAVATTVPAPAAQRDTLLYGSNDVVDRSLAITLRLDEPGYEQSPAGVTRTLGVEVVELADWQPAAALDGATRKALAEELSALHESGGLITGVVGSPREAKSLVAAELALALVELDVGRVLLLDGDLTHPTSAKTMNVKMPRSFGFSRQLEARAQGRLRAWNVVRCRPRLDILGEGIMRTPGLMVGPSFAESVGQLKSLYDFVVIDGPSLHEAADCRALDALLDATIFVHARKRAAELSRAATLFAKKRFSWTIACD